MSGINIKDVKITFGGKNLSEFCPYCQGQKGISPDGEEEYDEEADGIFLIGNEIRAQADCGWIVFKSKINFCPICGRKLTEEK